MAKYIAHGTKGEQMLPGELSAAANKYLLLAAKELVQALGGPQSAALKRLKEILASRSDAGATMNFAFSRL